MKKLIFSAGLGLAATSFGIIGGYPVSPRQYPQVVALMAKQNHCSAVIVGPKALLTSSACIGHDVKSGQVVIEGKSFQVQLIASPFFPQTEHDLAVGLATEKFPVEPLSILRSVSVGSGVTLVGYGCADKEIPDYDGILRSGYTRVSQTKDIYLITSEPGGGAACYGDSGGPVLYERNGRAYVVGSISFGDAQTKTYSVRLDSNLSTQFLHSVIDEEGAELCGINLDCY